MLRALFMSASERSLLSVDFLQHVAFFAFVTINLV